ncbi:MAG: 50S ribosomal protein L25 [Planctomycetota bacterium]|nr:50S ribosomal protein L25 [Planctomycetota bacterium]
MHEKSPMLKATKRDKTGTRYCERVRKSGGLPAIVYGHGQAPSPITLEARDAMRHINAGEKIFRLDFPGTKEKDEGQVVLLKDLQFDYLGTNIVHADFARVDLNERIRTRVPIHLIGEAPGLKQAGAILMHPTAEVVVECVVTELPDFIEVSILELDVGHAITAADVKLPTPGMKMITDSHAIVAQIIIQQEIKLGEATAADATAAAGPEVLTAKKEEGAEGAAKDAKAAAPAKDAKAAAPAKDAKAAPKK